MSAVFYVSPFMEFVLRASIPYIFLSTFFALVAITDQSLAAQKQRPYQMLDHLRQEAIGDLAWSPDGAMLGYTVRRAVTDETSKPIDFVWKKARDEISLWDRQSGEITKLVLPGDGSAGAWDMAWSGDGAYLAFQSDADGIINLWVWDREAGAVRQITEGGISRTGCEWVSGTDMFCAVSDNGDYQKPNHISGRHAVGGGIEAVRAAWMRAERNENTASAVDSMKFHHHPHTIVRVNVETGAQERIAAAFLENPLLRIRLADFAFKTSPDGANLVVRTDPSSTFPHFIRYRSGYPGTVSILQEDGRPLGIDGALPSDVILSTVKWSPDGRYLGFFALNGQSLHKDVMFEGKWEPLVYPEAASPEYPGGFYVVDTRSKTLRQVDIGAIDPGRDARPPRYEWRGSNQVMFYTVRHEERMTGASARWITLNLNGKISGNKDDLAGWSSQMVRADDGSLFGIVEGRLVRIDADGRLARVRLDGDDVAAVWLSRSKDNVMVFPDNSGNRFYAIDLQRNVLHGPFGAGTDYPQFSAFSADVFAYTETETGAEPLRISTPSGIRTLVMLNEHMADVRRFRQRVFSYTSANGTEEKGVITFPYGYDPKKQYPTVINSDIGYAGAYAAGVFVLDEDTLEHMAPAAFAAAGYVYVFLSMPTNELDDVGRANLLSFTSGILPGVDWLVREGIADPDRVFLYGASSMGYGVLGLVTQTSRFAAAISSVGYNDVTRFRDLDLDITNRYSPAAFDRVTGIGGYGLDADQPSFLLSEDYQRNTPMTYVDRVVTPLMIIAGDMDGSSMQNLEPFFSALVLRRVPARFVRYWGMGHYPRGVENTLDYHARMVRWFDYWGDIQRDEKGNILWDKKRIKPKPERRMEPLELYRSYPLFSTDVAVD